MFAALRHFKNFALSRMCFSQLSAPFRCLLKVMAEFGLIFSRKARSDSFRFLVSHVQSCSEISIVPLMVLVIMEAIIVSNYKHLLG